MCADPGPGVNAGAGLLSAPRTVPWFLLPLCPPDRALRWLLRGPIHAYRVAVSPFLPPSCRFFPTCSEYALEALRTRATPVAVWLIVRRLLRCHPWGEEGFDPVPPPSRGLPKRCGEASDSRAAASD